MGVQACSGKLPSEATGPRRGRSSGDGRAAQCTGNLLATRLTGGRGAASRECPSRAGPGPGPGAHWHSVAQAVPGNGTVTWSPGQGAPRGRRGLPHQAPSPSGPHPAAPWAQHEALGCAGFERSRLHFALPPQQRSQKRELGRGHQAARVPQDGPRGRGPWRRDRGQRDPLPNPLQGRQSWPAASARPLRPSQSALPPPPPWGCWGSARPHPAFTVTVSAAPLDPRAGPSSWPCREDSGTALGQAPSLWPPSTLPLRLWADATAQGDSCLPVALCSASVLSGWPSRPPRRGRADTSSRPGLTGAGS